MLKIGLVGWRGMVGSVLRKRMLEEKDFELIEPFFFTTSQAGQTSPVVADEVYTLLDAYDLKALTDMDVIITCQGSEYTNDIHSKLRNFGWKGYWIDAASALRMNDQSVIVLDPVNLSLIQESLATGVRDFIGGNCTVSLMLMGLGGLFKANLVEWATAMTYQAASGAGAKNMLELIHQMGAISSSVGKQLDSPEVGILDIDETVTQCLRSEQFPVDSWGFPLAGSILPWIGDAKENGQSGEEWKNEAETNKILGNIESAVSLDGLCVRIGAMRCHSQALTIKLRKDIAITDVENLIDESNPWSTIVPNEKNATLKGLTPAAVAGSLTVPVGRIRKMNIGRRYISAFTAGDQLLWGAAEPLRRMLRIVLDYLD